MLDDVSGVWGGFVRGSVGGGGGEKGGRGWNREVGEDCDVGVEPRGVV